MHTPKEGDRTRLVLLLAIGLAIELIYAARLVAPAWLPGHLDRERLDMVDLYGNGVPGMIAYAAPMLLAFALYLAALAAARGISSPRVAPVVVFAWAGIHAATFALMFPVAAMDVFDYALRARLLWVHHANPLTTLPLTYARDPFSSYAVWERLPSPYGPLWSIVAVAPAWLGHGDVLRTVLGFKALAVVFHLGTGALVYVGLKDRPAQRLPGTLLVLWNPLLQFETAGNGHNDGAMIFFVVLALLFAQRGRYLPSILALTASALFKFVSVLLLPPLLLYIALNTGVERRQVLLQAVGLSAALVVLAYGPFWEGTGTLSGVREQAGMLANSPAAVIARLLELHATATSGASITKWLMALGFGAVYLGVNVRPVLERRDAQVAIFLRPARSFAGLLTVTFDVLFLYLLFGSWFQPWYIIWLVPIAAVLADWRRAAVAVVFSLTAALMYVPVIFGWQRYFSLWDSTWPHRLAVLTVFPFPLLTWFCAVRGWPATMPRLPTRTAR